MEAREFSKADEIVRPGYYRVSFPDVIAEVSATDRVAFYRFSRTDDFSSRNSGVLFDLHSAPKSIASRKGCIDSRIILLNDSTAAGYRVSDEWAIGQKVWFVASFSAPVLSSSFYRNDSPVSMEDAAGDDVKAVFDFGERDCVCLKIAISYTSLEGAFANLESEGNIGFDEARRLAECRWNHFLSKIEFEGISPETDTLFYTALYHTAMSPQLFSDADGTYSGADGVVRKAEGFVPYTVFSLWDTWRAAAPLNTIIDENTGNYVNSLLHIAKESGRLPVWHLAGHETDCMVGVHSVPIMVDAALKGVAGVSPSAVFDAVKTLDRQPVSGMSEILEYGFIPAEKVNWSVSRALEYCIDDHAVSVLADRLGDTLSASRYAVRAKGYSHYFDPATGFMRGRLSDGSWRTPFDPSYSIHEEHDYVEGNAWQYTWSVPHDVDGLVRLFGSRESFVSMLDSLFSADSTLNEGASADITGMIGQFAHGNEPSHHIPYLYTLAGRPDRTAERVREICRRFYTTSPEGLIGNEDCGQMSAWYIFSALGFYPVNPVSGTYIFGSPLVRKAVIHTVSGKDFTIVTENNSGSNIYIRSVTLNGKKYDKPYITHEDIMKGGTLVFRMGKQPAAMSEDNTIN